jgi:hypothetical protein
VVVLLVAAGLGAIAAVGGLKQAPPSMPPQRQAGQEIDQDAFRTKIEGAVVHAVTYSGSDPSAKHTVLDLSLSVYNDAEVSVPLPYLESSLLRVVSRDGEKLMVPGAQDTWVYDATVPGEGASSRLLPPKQTSTVVIRLRRSGSSGDAGSAKYPDLLEIDVGKYENHEDALTGRRTAQLVTGDDNKPMIAAHVTVPVRKAV